MKHHKVLKIIGTYVFNIAFMNMKMKQRKMFTDLFGVDLMEVYKVQVEKPVFHLSQIS